MENKTWYQPWFTVVETFSSSQRVIVESPNEKDVVSRSCLTQKAVEAAVINWTVGSMTNIWLIVAFFANFDDARIGTRRWFKCPWRPEGWRIRYNAKQSAR
jgi:hypothetical protein